MITPKFKARVNFKSLIYDDIEHKKLGEYLKSLLGQEVSVVIKPWKEKDTRSNNQNRYYHGVLCKIMSGELGYTPEECHEMLKAKFLSRWETFDGKKGKIDLFITRSTTELKTNEFEEYCSKIRQWASIEFGIYLPEPNEVEL